MMSIFAGALTDRFDKKKTMLVCDVLAVMCSVAIFILYKANALMIWHLYALNAFSGLMNTVQQPASEVAMTLIVPERKRINWKMYLGLLNLKTSRSDNCVCYPNDFFCY